MTADSYSFFAKYDLAEAVNAAGSPLPQPARLKATITVAMEKVKLRVVMSFACSRGRYSEAPRGLFQATTVHKIIERGTAHPQQLRCLAEVAVDPPEYAQDSVLFGFLTHVTQIQKFRLNIGRGQTQI